MFALARSPRRADAIRSSASRAVLALVGLVCGCPNDVRDSHCTPDAPNRDSDPNCIYAGDGKGPLFVEPQCPDVEGVAPAVCPTFEQVFGVLIDPTKGNCSAGGCHGVVPGSLGIYLPTSDPCAFYAQLTSINPRGEPYVQPDDPATPENEARASYILCNLRGQHGGGFPMPIPAGMPNLADVDIVERWLLCGAPGPDVSAAAGGGIPETCPTGSGGGGMGGGGMGGGDGGAGGAGGMGGSGG